MSTLEKDPFEMGIKEMDDFLERYELKRVHTDFLQKITLLIIASLGFVAALSWDQVLKSAFIQFFGDVDSLSTKFLYAFIVTALAVAVSILLSKFVLRKKGKK
jgi:hypothetical protein